MVEIGVENGAQPEPRNEIKLYQDSKYLAAPEAAWRNLEFSLHGRYPSILRLPIHLEGQQWVTFVQGQLSEQLRSENFGKTLYENFLLYLLWPNMSEPPGLPNFLHYAKKTPTLEPIRTPV